IKSTVVNSGETFMLSPSTKYLKIMVDNLTDGQYVNCRLVYFAENGQTKWVYNNRFTDEVFSFVYEVYTNEGREVLVNDDFTTTQYTTEKYYNKALLKLPPNYDPFGAPVKLILANGGAGSHLSWNQQNFETKLRPYYQYLVDEG